VKLTPHLNTLGVEDIRNLLGVGSGEDRSGLGSHLVVESMESGNLGTNVLGLTDSVVVEGLSIIVVVTNQSLAGGLGKVDIRVGNKSTGSTVSNETDGGTDSGEERVGGGILEPDLRKSLASSHVEK